MAIGHRWFGAAALATLALAANLAGASSAAARPLTPAETRDQPYSGLVKPCNDPMPLGYIKGAFEGRETEYWHSGLSIVGFADVHEVGFRSNGLDYIPRRYCQASAEMSDGKVRSVSYLITEAAGGIGFADGVTWCLVGLDRNDAFAPACLEAQP